MTSLQQPVVDGTLSSSAPHPTQYHVDRGGYPLSSTPNTRLGIGSAGTDFAITPGNPIESSPLSQAAASTRLHSRFNEEWDASQRGSSIADGPTMHRSNSMASQGETPIPSRGGTLKKKSSLRRANSLKRGGSRRSSRAGSVRSLALEPEENEINSAFFSPVPTSGNPTDILANRFSTWRKVLKDLITYYREIQAQYDHKAKSLLKVSNIINNTTVPPIFLASGGIHDALQILRGYHSQAIMEANKAKTIENDVILALTGLRSDLQQKIKEIKNLSGDFKNSVEKEMENTRKAAQYLVEALGQADIDPSQRTGKQDPYLLKIAVDRQVERQIDEENYLHQAYLNLETSGRELESIIVGEIQKAYNAFAGILKREADESYNTVDALRAGPISMPKDREWTSFIENDEHFVDPRIPIREAQNIRYPGCDHELTTEVRAGLLERKSKYLKSYTAGWYVLTPTHLHEFKSADKTQAPIMSLYLPDQKLGSHSVEGGSSNKFILKGRQTGSMHRGHSWVFRAESHDTMMAWYEDIKSLTEKSLQERNAFVRQHTRSLSGTSQRAASISSDGAVDEEDDEPFSAGASGAMTQGSKQDVISTRPKPGGRFPSDLQVNAARGLLAAQDPLSPSSGSSGIGDIDTQDRDIVAAAADLPGSGIGEHYKRQTPYGLDAHGVGQSHASQLNHYAQEDGINPYTNERVPIQKRDLSRFEPTLSGAASLEAGATSAEGLEVHRDYQAASAPEVISQVGGNSSLSGRSRIASIEPAQVAAPGKGKQSAAAAATSVAAVAYASKPRTNQSGFSTEGRDHGEPGVSTDAAYMEPSPKELSSSTSGPPLNVSHSQAEYEIVSKSDIPIQSMDIVGQAEEPTRPSLMSGLKAGQHHDSVSTISELHVPGEFPRADTVMTAFN